MRLDPADFEHRQQLGRRNAQEVHGDGPGFFARGELAADQVEVHAGKAFQTAICGDDRAEMFAAEGSVAAIAPLIADKLGPLAIDRDETPGDLGVAGRHERAGSCGGGAGCEGCSGHRVPFPGIRSGCRLAGKERDRADQQRD